jgi:hypothetical protein
MKNLYLNEINKYRINYWIDIKKISNLKSLLNQFRKKYTDGNNF